MCVNLLCRSTEETNSSQMLSRRRRPEVPETPGRFVVGSRDVFGHTKGGCPSKFVHRSFTVFPGLNYPTPSPGGVMGC